MGSSSGFRGIRVPLPSKRPAVPRSRQLPRRPPEYRPVTAIAGSAAHGPGRSGRTPRASCPWARASPPIGFWGGFGPRRKWWVASLPLLVGGKEEERRRRGSPPAAGILSGPPQGRRASCPPLVARSPCGVASAVPAGPLVGGPARRPRPGRSAARPHMRHQSLLCSLRQICFRKTTHAVFLGKIAVLPDFRLVKM